MKLLILFYFLFSTFCLAGSRPAEFTLVDISSQPLNKEGKRLFELIEKDLKMLYNDAKYDFAWETVDTKVRLVKSSDYKAAFSPMIILKDKKLLKSLMEKDKPADGLIVFEYDLKGMKVRLKHFDWKQEESMLIRLPLNNGGAMNLSLWKDRRRAALVALGKSFEFSP